MHEADTIPAAAHVDFRIPMPYEGIPVGDGRARTPPAPPLPLPEVPVGWAGARLAPSTQIPMPAVAMPPHTSADDGISLASTMIGQPVPGTNPAIDSPASANVIPLVDVAKPGIGRGGVSPIVGPGGVIGLPAASARAAQVHSAPPRQPTSERGMVPPMIPPAGARAGNGVRPSAMGRVHPRARHSNGSDDWLVPTGHPEVIVPTSEPTLSRPRPRRDWPRPMTVRFGVVWAGLAVLLMPPFASTMDPIGTRSGT